MTFSKKKKKKNAKEIPHDYRNQIGSQTCESSRGKKGIKHMEIIYSSIKTYALSHRLHQWRLPSPLLKGTQNKGTFMYFQTRTV